MACYDCELCKHAEYCNYSFAYPDCYIGTIRAAREIVDDNFREFYSKLKKKAEKLYDHHIDYVVESMRSIIYDSNQRIPDWAVKEE